MKQIIKNPHYQVRCYSCACHFTFDLEDIIGESGAGKVICPNCRARIPTHDSNGVLVDKVKVVYRKENK